jgi:hypothetical protein
MKNFQEKEIKDLNEIVGGADGGFMITKGLKVDADGNNHVSYDVAWVKYK